jgi:hypothetical protein
MQDNRIEGNHGVNHRGNPPKPQVKVKVFALGQNELEATSAMVKGTLTIQNCSVNVLINPGYSHS